MISIWSILALAGLSWVLDRDLSPGSPGDVLLYILNTVIEATVSGSLTTASWSPPEPSHDWRLRATYAWGFALEHADLFGIVPNNQRLVSSAFIDALGQCDHELTPLERHMPLLQLGECLSYIASDDFLQRDWCIERKAIGAAVSLIRAALNPRNQSQPDCGDWSPTLSRILRNAFSIPALAWTLSQTAASLSAFLAVGIKTTAYDHELHQTAVIQVLGSHITTGAIPTTSQPNILSRTSHVDTAELTSTWRQMRAVTLAYPPSWNEPVPFAACDLVGQLCVLHRMREHIDSDTSRGLLHMLEELLEDEHGIRILRRFPTIRLFLAQHGREISQDWWSRTSRSLCKPMKPPSDTVPGLPTSPDAEQHCLQGQISFEYREHVPRYDTEISFEYRIHIAGRISFEYRTSMAA